MKKYARIKSTGEIAQIHVIDFSNEYVEVVDRMEFNDLATYSIDELEFIDDELELNDNQKIVLEWLKKKTQETVGYPFWSLECLSSKENRKEIIAIGQMSKKEESEVLKAFAEWGLEQCQTIDTGE